IYVLIKTMGEFGSSLSDMEAHIFGGSKSLDHTHQQGMVEVENIRVARTTLERYNIKVVSEDVGGHMGRKIVFNTATNEVLVYKVEKIRKEDWWTGDS
ncbi:MAG: chemotaxis protein CheD, partial [Thermodesulfobacteriota bacterium]